MSWSRRPPVTRRTCVRPGEPLVVAAGAVQRQDRKSTRLNSSHANISYAVFCLKKKHYHPLRLKSSKKPDQPLIALLTKIHLRPMLHSFVLSHPTSFCPLLVTLSSLYLSPIGPA